MVQALHSSLETGTPVWRRGLCPLIMAGDPDLDCTQALLERCIALGVPMVELCLPFRNAFTDGETLQKAHARGLHDEASLEDYFDLIASVSDRIRVVLLADSSHTLRPHGLNRVLQGAARAGAAGVLPHGLPPRMAVPFHAAAMAAGLAVVGTIYANARVETRQAVLQRATAFIYLVTSYGRSGGAADPEALQNQIEALRSHTDLPVALGFGLRTPENVAQAFAAGCDIAIVGSAISGEIEAALAAGEDPVRRAGDFIGALQDRCPR
ncbi:tryptophan synthase subunit alpha [uncultured Roseobacter sp.]|uniref:tryptophan synthase subunit alpha n=1 Tax=uncultured Roseobacter sp. TaxID=114847 RepID=UPI00262E6FAE|nr:tryptophan synthase subunit alpha [uncultured Roseobacter sp.]